jgi:hypothetical protein
VFDLYRSLIGHAVASARVKYGVGFLLELSKEWIDTEKQGWQENFYTLRKSVVCVL